MPEGRLNMATLAELLPWYNRTAQWTDWSMAKSYQQGYTASVWVYVCVEARRRAVASVPWRVERWQGGEWVEATGSALEALLENPNPGEGFQRIVGRCMQSLDLSGNAYLLKTRAGAGRVPVEMWMAPPDAMRVERGRQKLVDGYYLNNRPVSADDVVHLAFPSPADPVFGIPPLRAAGMSVDVDVEAQTFQKVSMQNRGIPDGVFTLKSKDGMPITRDQFDEARRAVREQYQQEDGRRAPWVVADAEWRQMSLNPAELDFVNSRAATRIEIMAAYGVPPPMAGVYDDATLANIREARRIFWIDTIIPVLEELKGAFNASLAPEFGESFRIVYDVSNVEALREKFAEKLEAAERLFRMGVPLAVVNQRMELGLPEVEGDGVGYVPAGLVPVGMQEDVGEGLGPKSFDEAVRLAYGKRDGA